VLRSENVVGIGSIARLTVILVAVFNVAFHTTFEQSNSTGFHLRILPLQIGGESSSSVSKPMNPRGKPIEQTTAVLVLLGVALFAVTPHVVVRAENPSPFPDPAILQTGDLIWPKKPGAIVPYNSRPGEASTGDRNRWETEKRGYLTELKKKPNPTDEEKRRYSLLQGMTYDQFAGQYLETVNRTRQRHYRPGLVRSDMSVSSKSKMEYLP